MLRGCCSLPFPPRRSHYLLPRLLLLLAPLPLSLRLRLSGLPPHPSSSALLPWGEGQGSSTTRSGGSRDRDGPRSSLAGCRWLLHPMHCRGSMGYTFMQPTLTFQAFLPKVSVGATAGPCESLDRPCVDLNAISIASVLHCEVFQTRARIHSCVKCFGHGHLARRRRMAEISSRRCCCLPYFCSIPLCPPPVAATREPSFQYGSLPGAGQRRSSGRSEF